MFVSCFQVMERPCGAWTEQVIQEETLKQTAAPNVKGHVPGQIIKHLGAREHLVGVNSG